MKHCNNVDLKFSDLISRLDTLSSQVNGLKLEYASLRQEITAFQDRVLSLKRNPNGAPSPPHSEQVPQLLHELSEREDIL